MALPHCSSSWTFGIVVSIWRNAGAVDDQTLSAAEAAGADPFLNQGSLSPERADTTFDDCSDVLGRSLLSYHPLGCGDCIFE